jgi:hypothetical protein
MIKDKLYAFETAVNVGGSLLLKVLSHVSSPSHQRKAEPAVLHACHLSRSFAKDYKPLNYREHGKDREWTITSMHFL